MFWCKYFTEVFHNDTLTITLVHNKAFTNFFHQSRWHWKPIVTMKNVIGLHFKATCFWIFIRRAKNSSITLPKLIQTIFDNKLATYFYFTNCLKCPTYLYKLCLFLTVMYINFVMFNSINIFLCVLYFCPPPPPDSNCWKYVPVEQINFLPQSTIYKITIQDAFIHCTAIMQMSAQTYNFIYVSQTNQVTHHHLTGQFTLTLLMNFILDFHIQIIITA
jgi:hypothetical protein